MSWPLLIVGLVALQRLGELVWAERNTCALLRRGAVEHGRAHYPLIVGLHVAWFAAILATLPADARIHGLPLAGMIFLQAMRFWVLASLGPWFTTRIVTLDAAPLVKRGPYRFMRHPNYAVVVGEIALLPLVFGQVAVAIVFTILNAAMLAWRIRAENAALASRR